MSGDAQLEEDVRAINCLIPEVCNPKYICGSNVRKESIIKNGERS